MSQELQVLGGFVAGVAGGLATAIIDYRARLASNEANLPVDRARLWGYLLTGFAKGAIASGAVYHIGKEGAAGNLSGLETAITSYSAMYFGANAFGDVSALVYGRLVAGNTNQDEPTK